MAVDDDAIGFLLDELGIELEPNEVAHDVAAVAHALQSGARPADVEREAARAAEAVWNDETRSELADDLRLRRGETLLRLETIDETLRELEEPPSRNRVALALVYRAAADLLHRANENYERVAALEEELKDAPADRHRAIALPVAATAIPAARIGLEEAYEAAARFLESFPEDWERRPEAADQAAHRLARTLGTDERRQAMRAALAELAEVSTEEFPLASEALERLLAEPMPDDAADDDLWVNLVIGLVHEELGGVDVDAPEEGAFFRP